MAMVNGLYEVPQTDATSEAAMAAFVVRLRASLPKPEAIPTGATVDTQLALDAAEQIAAVSSALGDRATLPILRWDAALDGAARRLTARQWFNTRGRDRQAGADKSIDQQAQEALDYLARLRPSGDANGKSENPRFIDSGGNVPLDAPGIKSSATSDDWIARRSGRATR